MKLFKKNTLGDIWAVIFFFVAFVAITLVVLAPVVFLVFNWVMADPL